MRAFMWWRVKSAGGGRFVLAAREAHFSLQRTQAALQIDVIIKVKSVVKLVCVRVPHAVQGGARDHPTNNWLTYRQPSLGTIHRVYSQLDVHGRSFRWCLHSNPTVWGKQPKNPSTCFNSSYTVGKSSENKWLRLSLAPSRYSLEAWTDVAKITAEQRCPAPKGLVVPAHVAIRKSCGPRMRRVNADNKRCRRKGLTHRLPPVLVPHADILLFRKCIGSTKKGAMLKIL